jgi:hypothetical protein
MENPAKVTFTFIDVLFFIFLILKLTGTITWSWWWVTAPLWFPTAVVIGILILVILLNRWI